MPDEIVRIDHLQLRVLRLGPDEARRLGQQVCRRVADGLPIDATPRHLGALEIQLPTPGDGGPGGLSKAIADAILGKIA